MKIVRTEKKSDLPPIVTYTIISASTLSHKGITNISPGR